MNIMYKVKDTVLYGTQGVCEITEITEKKFGDNRIPYYVLKPVYSKDSTIFVPVNNESLTAKMRRILSAREIYELIKIMPEEKLIWIEDENERKERYKEIVMNGDREMLVSLIKTLHQKQQSQVKKGRKLHVADERLLKEAEKILYDEFAHVLKIERDQVLPFILEQIKVDEKRQS